MQKLKNILKALDILLKLSYVLLIIGTIGLIISLLVLVKYNEWEIIHKLGSILLLYIEAWVLWFLGWGILTFVQRVQNGTIDLQKHLDFGIATKEEIIEIFGEVRGKAIIEERRLVFWRFAFIWATFGAIVTIILDHYFHIITTIETILKLYFGV